MSEASTRERPASPLPYDSLGMWDLALSLPEQVLDACRRAEGTDIASLERPMPISNVVVFGMGGSGIAGDVLAAYARPRSKVPVSVVKSYDVPAFVGPDSLVIAVSCSGDTEETVSAASGAIDAGASLVAVCSGGSLATLAESARAPRFKVPVDIPQPRAALGALAAPLLVLMERLGLLDGASAELTQAATDVQRRRDTLGIPGSVDEAVSQRIGEATPLVHGGPGLTAVAAMRWKTQVNENAKAPCFWSEQPELCHNEIAGWGVKGDLTRQVLTLVALRGAHEHPQVSRRMAIVEEIMLEVMADVVEVHAEGGSELSRFLHHVLIGDLVSLRLAGREQVDPGPVPVLGEIKESVGA